MSVDISTWWWLARHVGNTDPADAAVLALLHEATLLLAGGQRIEWVTMDGRLVGFQLKLDAAVDDE